MILRLAQLIYALGGLGYFLVALWAIALNPRDPLTNLSTFLAGCAGLAFGILVASLIGTYRHKKKR